MADFFPMSSSHSAVLPRIALQLVVVLDRYRQAMRSTAVSPDNDDAWKTASAALRRAGMYAFSLPVIWVSWSEVVLRHVAFFQEAISASPGTGLQAAWARVDDGVEIVTQRCLEWALRDEHAGAITAEVAVPFRAWDRARRDAFHLGRRLAALHEGGVQTRADAAAAEVRRACEEASVSSARLLAEALAALQGMPPPGAGDGDGAREVEALYVQWCLAERAAAAAEIEIIDTQLQRLDIPGAQRRRAAELRRAATYCRQALLGAGEI